MIRAGFGMFDDRYNLTFFFVPNTQKMVPGLGAIRGCQLCQSAERSRFTGQDIPWCRKSFP